LRRLPGRVLVGVGRMISERDMLARFQRVQRLREGDWLVTCPSHADRTPSLHVTLAEDRWLLDCKAGCAFEDVLAQAGLEARDLFAENGNGRREIVAEYDYVNEAGELLFQVVRFAPKDFRQRRADGAGGWEWRLNGTRRVLYRLPNVISSIKAGEPVFVTEGEKDVHALERFSGLAATCNPGGAGKWRAEYSEALRGADVAVVADRDEPGRKHAAEVARALEGVAADVAVLEPTKGKDVAENLAAGGGVGELADVTPIFLSATKGLPVAESISAANEESGESGLSLPFARVGDVIANAPPEPDWTWQGYLAPESIALLAGRPKVGKSTLVFGLIGAILAGVPFAGRRTRQGGVLLLTEEGTDTIAEKARRFGVADHPDFHLLSRRQAQAAWTIVVAQARAYCRAHGVRVLVVDTLDKWTGLRGDDENKSGVALQAYEPLLLAAGDGLAVVVVGHQRKASGEHGEAVRGTNAQTGSVDVVIEVERVKDVPHARVLYGTSRFAGTREELALELTDDAYVDRGDAGALRERLERDKVLAVLSSEPIGSQELAEATEIPEATVRRRLGDLLEQGTVERVGEGRKGSPYRWKILSATAEPIGGGKHFGSSNGHDPDDVQMEFGGEASS
jgi:putative DNA primase/helicase